ncbi:transposase [Enterococcus eurekensis]|uniref:Transposase n=1 Tax=Enterococcus eurekensis TaxID=1159753 RepID=A0ABV9M6T0_9ENTE
MSKARKTTFEEPIEIVHDCLMNQRNYGQMAIKYQVSYQQVRNWVLKYEAMGEIGLQDRRGHRAGTIPSRTPEGTMHDQLAIQERRIKQLEMENNLLKKVRAFERMWN